MKKIYINLHFLTKNKTGGVWRFAHETAKALDEVLNTSDICKTYEFIGLLPEIDDFNLPQFKNIKLSMKGKIKNRYIWEQITLPIISRDGFLINLCNFAPLFKKNQICVIHDALIYKYPQSYSFKVRFLTKIFNYFILKSANFIGTVSDFSKKEIVNYIGKSKNDIIILNNSAENFKYYISDNSILDRYKLIKDNYILAVFSQKNSTYKNIERILKCARYFNLKLVIAGAVNIKNNYDNIICVGIVTDNDLKALYEDAYCFIFPSLYEGFGIPLLEAMSVGCPVLASDIEVVKEITSNLIWYFNPCISNDIVSVVNNLIANPQEKAALIQNGYKIVDKYSWRNNAVTLLNLIDNLSF